MKTLGTSRKIRPSKSPLGWLVPLLLLSLCAQAAPLVTTDSPIGFFTNIASRLLSNQFGLDLNHLQVYPTNQYTPAVHRYLQVTANLYDAAVTRPFATDYPFLPTVFRPLFRRETNGAIFIAGYREVVDDTLANFSWDGLGTVVLGVNNSAVPLSGTPFGVAEGSEALVVGIPLVIGAKKGLPNFNEFGLQTGVTISRKLQFRRPPGSDNGPIAETNQMYLVSITNGCGAELWNSYHSTYPRSLQVHLEAVMLAVITNEYGALLLSNAIPLRPPSTLVTSNAWPAFPLHSTSVTSFKAVLGNFLVLTNSMYSFPLQRLMTNPADFERGIGFPVPHWYLGLRTLVRFALVDTSVSPARIVDYVSLDAGQALTEVTALLGSGGQCGSPYGPNSAMGSMWCTNRLSDSVSVPTYGILNQITTSLGNIEAAQWPSAAHHADIDFFRTQFGLSPIYYPSTGFTLTNVFSCPYTAMRAVVFETCWQANDPLVHYTVPDLTDALANRPSVELDVPTYSPLGQLGGLDLVTGQAVGSSTALNGHHRPWGGYPFNSAETTPLATNWKLALKDPLVRFSDDWNFPTNPPPDLSWLGQVHRGTPWQTIYLKSSTNDLPTWMLWTGDNLVTDYGITGGPLVPDAAMMFPTGDWHLAAWLVSLLSTNDPRSLLSVNEPGPLAWESALDGLSVLTNSYPEAQLLAYRYFGSPPFDTLLMQSSSDQAALVTDAIRNARASQPGQRFADLGDVLSAPTLSAASPFLNQGSRLNTLIHPAVYTYEQTYGLSEAEYEAIPAQLLPRLRPDSLASVLSSTSPVQVQFTGADGYRYAVEVSSNLVDWVEVSTNYPLNGRFVYQESPPSTVTRRFYRSSLLP